MAWNPAVCEASGGGTRVSFRCRLVKRDHSYVICHLNLSTVGAERLSNNSAGPAAKPGRPRTVPALRGAALP